MNVNQVAVEAVEVGNVAIFSGAKCRVTRVDTNGVRFVVTVQYLGELFRCNHPNSLDRVGRDGSRSFDKGAAIWIVA